MKLLKKFGFLIIFLLMLTISVMSEENTDIILNGKTWDGYINIHLNKDIFSNDEEITGFLIIENSEKYPLIGQRIILQLAIGEYQYPSHTAKDNILKEIIIDDDWILPRSLKRLEFNLGKLPPNNYRIDAYSWAQKSLFVGSNSKLLNPISSNFTVEGNINTKEIYIQRNTTNFGKNKTVGPIGFLVKPNEQFQGEVFITNNTNQQQNNLQLAIEICDWSSAFCITNQHENHQQKIIKEIIIPKIQPNQTIKVDVELTAPKIPSEYEINLILKEKNEIYSIYKNRFNVEGGTAKIKKILLGGLKDKNYFLKVIFTGSPDHFTRPDFDDFNIKMSVYNQNNLVNEQTKEFNKIKNEEVKVQDFYIDQKLFDKICIEINKNNQVYDKECLNVNIKLLQNKYDTKYPEEINIEHNYDEINKKLNIILSKEISNIINARIKILKQNNITFSEENLNEYGMVIREYDLEKENYTIIIDDFDAKKQRIIYLNLSDSDQYAFDKNQLTSCNGAICQNSTVCSIKTFNSNEGPCCLGDCIIATQSKGTLDITTVPLILWIILISLIIIISFLINLFIIKRRKK